MSGDTLLPAAVPGAGPRQAMSLPHNIDPAQMTGAEQSGNRWKRFQPLKKLQRIFRRKGKTKDENGYPEATKSFSASHLLPGQAPRTSQSGSPPLQSRLSMSHDSIFQSEAAQQDELGSALSIPSIPGTSSQLTAELRGVLLKRRGDDSDDDPGLPHSPVTPPNAARLQKELKGQSGKSGGSCSDGSLLSMYSSGTCTDDDIFGPLSKHPSKASLGRDQDNLDLETSAALSHSAAKHRISVRPRRNHGAPRQHRARARPQTSPAAGLPPTVEEESPPPTPTAARTGPISTASNASALLSPEQERRAPSPSPTRTQSIRVGSPDGATVAPRPTHIKRSKSSVAERRVRDLSPRKFRARDAAAAEPEERKAESFFSRIFGSRRSGRKKKDGRSLSPETTAEEASPAVARPPAGPRPAGQRQRATFAGDVRSPPSAMHADIIRPAPAPAAAPMVAAAAAAAADGEVPRPPDALLRRGGPAFLADVRAEVRALATGADRGDDSVTVSPQVLRRHRVSAAAAGRTGAGSPRARPKLVGLTSYQQRVAHLQAGTPSPERETKRRSFSCENISDDGGRRDSCSGMALGSVLNLIKSTTAGEVAGAEPRLGADEAEPNALAARASRQAAGSPGAGPKSLDSSLLGGAAEPAAPPLPQKSSSAESMQSDAPEWSKRRSPERAAVVPAADAVPEFLRVHLQKVDGRQASSEPVAARAREVAGPASVELRRPGKSAAPAAASPPQRSPASEKRASGSDGRDSAERESRGVSPRADAESPPARRPVPAPRATSPQLPRRPSLARPRPADAEPVVLRNKPAPSEDSELLKVFKRRSLKSRDLDEWPAPAAPADTDAGADADAELDEKENEKPREETEETVVCASVASVSRETPTEGEARRPDARDAEPGRSRHTSGGASPARLRRAEFPRAARASAPVERAPPAEPPAGRPVSEAGEARRVSVTRRDSETRRLSQPDDDAVGTVGWLKQTVRERREQREQREQQHLRTAHHKELIIEDPSVASRGAAATRSSRVLEMANTFQKLQTT